MQHFLAPHLSPALWRGGGTAHPHFQLSKKGIDRLFRELGSCFVKTEGNKHMNYYLKVQFWSLCQPTHEGCPLHSERLSDIIITNWLRKLVFKSTKPVVSLGSWVAEPT